jgi:hypothetical protein
VAYGQGEEVWTRVAAALNESPLFKAGVTWDKLRQVFNKLMADHKDEIEAQTEGEDPDVDDEVLRLLTDIHILVMKEEEKGKEKYDTKRGKGLSSPALIVPMCPKRLSQACWVFFRRGPCKTRTCNQRGCHEVTGFSLSCLGSDSQCFHFRAS